MIYLSIYLYFLSFLSIRSLKGGARHLQLQSMRDGGKEQGGSCLQVASHDHQHHHHSAMIIIIVSVSVSVSGFFSLSGLENRVCFRSEFEFAL